MSNLREGVTSTQHRVLDDLERWREDRERDCSVAEQLARAGKAVRIAQLDLTHSVPSAILMCETAAALLIQVAERLEVDGVDALDRRVRASRNQLDWPDAPLPDEPRAQRLGLRFLAACCLPWLPLLWWIFTR